MFKPILALGIVLVVLGPTPDQRTQPDEVRYLRPAAQGFAPECTFAIMRNAAGWQISSVTDRGDAKLTVTADFDREERLTGAAAVLTKDKEKSRVEVKVADGKATIKRVGQPPQEFAVPMGVIVTSAPDWSDTFLLCRRYDRAKGGKQPFTGLWIHPTQPAQLLPFSIERTGTDTIQHEGKPMQLERYAIQIRGPNGYVAWADAQGKMVRLIPLPYRPGSASGLYLEGYEKSAGELQPEAK